MSGFRCWIPKGYIVVCRGNLFADGSAGHLSASVADLAAVSCGYGANALGGATARATLPVPPVEGDQACAGGVTALALATATHALRFSLAECIFFPATLERQVVVPVGPELHRSPGDSE